MLPIGPNEHSHLQETLVVQRRDKINRLQTLLERVL